MSQWIENLLGCLSLGGSLCWRITLHCLVSAIIPNSSGFLFLDSIFFRNFAYECIWERTSVKQSIYVEWLEHLQELSKLSIQFNFLKSLRKRYWRHRWLWWNVLGFFFSTFHFLAFKILLTSHNVCITVFPWIFILTW